MKKLFILILALMLLLTACGKPADDKSKDESSPADTTSDADSTGEENTSSEEESMETSEETSTPVERTWPVVSGTFIQPWACGSWSLNQWKTHFDGLKEVGIDIFIIQWIADTPYGKFKTVYYPSNLTADNKTNDYTEYPNMLPTILQAAEEKGIKVFVGLNISDEWWSIAVTNNEWNKTQSQLGMQIATEIYNKYKSQYPNALHGWYFTWEMYNGMSGNETKAGEFLNMYLDPLTELDDSMPMLLSPFVRSGGGSAAKAGEEWKKVFATANFRPGDIFCCQDAVGAGHIKIDQLDAYFAALKEAVDTEEGLLFWANSENFTTDFNSAYISRFIRQMEIANPYVSGYVTFAYSHYYAKDYNNKAAFHRAYKHYYETGEKDVVLEEPEVSIDLKEGGKAEIRVDVQNNAAGIEKVVISVEGRSDVTKQPPVAQLNKDSFTYTQTVTLNQGESELKVTVTVYDYYGNSSSTSTSLTID